MRIGCAAEIRHTKSISFRPAATAWFRIISAWPCIRIGRTGNIAGRSIHSWWPGAWDRANYTTNRDSWTGSDCRAPGLGGSVRSVPARLSWQKPVFSTGGARPLASSIPIQRHVKVKGEANPYDPAYESYFEKREGDHMSATFQGTRTLRSLWNVQAGLCAVCKERITRITGWRLHYCVPRVLGGSHSVENRALLHPECHDRVHRQHLSVSKPRLPERGVRRA